MGGRRPLKASAPRLLSRHDGAEGREYRRAYDALAEEFDLRTPLLRLEAGRVAVAWCQLVATTKALSVAQRERRVGRGRRPGGREIERLARRQGLADGSYSQALDKLRGLASTRKLPTLADAIRQRRREGETA